MRKRRKTSRPTTRPTTRSNRTITGSFRRPRNRRTTGRQPKMRRPRWIGGLGGLAGLVPWVLGLAALTGAGIGVHFGWQAVRSSTRLRVQSVEVLGSARTRWAELEAYTGIHVGDGIFDLDLDGAALGLRRHPWIESAKVRRRLPNHVALEVTEHEPRILVSLGEVYVANAEGVLFKRLAAADGVVLPVLTGLEKTDASRDGERTADVIREGIALAEATAEPAVTARLGRLEEVHWDADLGWSLITLRRSNSRLQTHLGFDPVPRLDTTLAAIDRLVALKREPAVIWADGSFHRVQVAFGHQSPKEIPTLIAKAGE